jgi:uncharacterized alkaline shock family protein YloU
MSGDNAAKGSINITDEAIGELVAHTCMRSYGIIGMASQGLQEGVAQLLGRDSLRKGVRVHRRDGEVALDLYVIIEAGVNITEVAHNLIDQVKYLVSKSTGTEVGEVQVHVQGVRGS